MIIENIMDIKDKVGGFRDCGCVVIICRYNGGKSSVAAEIIHEYFGEENTYYATFIDQSKPNFTPRKSRLGFNDIVKNKVIVFDEIADEEDRDVRNYLKKLIEENFVVILSNPYASSNDAGREISLFREHEKNILPDNVLFIFVMGQN